MVVFQGEEDNYHNCCTVGRMREIERAAKESGKRFDLFVYPNAGHGFNLKNSYHQRYDEDSWQKTLDILKQYNPKSL